MLKEADSEPPSTPVGHGTKWVRVAATTSVQALMSLALLMLAAIAPAVATDLEVSPSLIGVQISIAYGTACLFSVLAGAMVRRWGACRTSQTSLVLGIIGCTLATIPSLPTVALASVFLGCGYAMTNPSASHLLSRVATARDRNLIFSIKQTGVPLGGAIAGLMAPPLAGAFGWRAVPVVVGVSLLILAASMQPARKLWDADREPRTPLRGNPVAGLRLVWRLPPVRWVAATSFFFTITQLCLISFLVTLLVEDVGMSLIEAGLLLSIVQVASVGGRLLWGWLADRVRDGAAVLIGLGLLAAAAAALSTAVGPHWPLIALQALFVVFGMASIGWNGVFMAELARLSPRGQIGPTTGASLVLTFGGVMFGPALFTVLYGAIGSYATTYGALTLASAVGAGFALLSRRAARKEPSGSS